MMNQLDNALHIHVTQTDRLAESTDCILNEAEQKKAARFMFAKDRQLYTTAHVFLRQVLSRYAPISPADWQFNTNEYGKPSIANAGYQHLQFNLSHTTGLVAVALTANRVVGVDVEQGSRNLRDMATLGRSVFAAEEMQNLLSNNSPAEQRHKFFTYWTLKEAYIKARGMGMSLPLKKFFFSQNHAASATLSTVWQLNCQPELQDQGSRWLCHAMPLSQHYFLAYVTEAGLDPADIHVHLPSNIQLLTGPELPIKAR